MLVIRLYDLFGVALSATLQFFLDFLNTWIVDLLGFGEEE